MATAVMQAYAGVKILHFDDVVSSLRGHAKNDDAIRWAIFDRL